ncbi:hypothetical protein FRC10_004354 [Ceratobasidium sp. 414]|nr:hypothetical protein FRC10_004354 [Ceratobasidium sp. 414]
MMSDSDSDDRDSGGANGLSTATVLDQVMKRVQFEEGLSEPPSVEEYFDIVAGAGTGAILMTLVGRLGMTTEEAMVTFARLSKEVFMNEKTFGTPAFKASKLEKTLKDIVRERTGNEDEPMLDVSSRKCNTMVFAISKHNMNSGTPTTFRSYNALVDSGPNCTIWEALRATTAHPDMFKSMDIVEHGIRQPFVDAAMGCGNPIEHVLAEVKRIYPNRRVSCIVSIGAGHPSTIRIPEPNPFQRIFPTNVITAMRDIATDSERMAQTMATRFRGFPGAYFRLNVDQGMQDVRLGDWDRLGEVKAHTRAYMQKAETNRLMWGVVKAMREEKGVIPVEQIARRRLVAQLTGYLSDGELQAASGQQLSGVKQCPAPTSVYTERPKPIEQAISCLTANAHERRIFVFHGLGGAGKTQLALQTVERTREYWSDVIYADATSAESLTSTLREFAIARKIGETHEDTLRWLSSYTKPWLLLFDNADDSTLDLQTYLPRGTHGRVLITTRARGVALLAKGPNSDYNVSSMEPEESLRLLLTVARSDRARLSNEDKQAATALVQDLGYMALAVVQAGAYIWRTSCGFDQYREMYKKRPREMLEKYSKMPLKVGNYEKTVYVTWMLSYDLLSSRAQKMLWLMAYLQRDRITQEIFQRAAARTKSFKPTLPLNDLDDRALDDTKSYLSGFLDSDGKWDLDLFLTTITEITSCSLVSFDRVNGIYELHALVQGWAHTVIPYSPEVARAQSTFLLALSIDQGEYAQDYLFRRSLELHVNSVLEGQGTINLDSARYLSRVLHEVGRFEEAKALRIRVLEGTKETLGDSHPITLTAMGNLATTYSYQGLHERAETLQVQVLEGRKRALGDDHPDTLVAMGNLANTYSHQGLHKRAVMLQVQVLEGCKRALGDNHPDTLAAMGNLARTYSYQGLYKQAEKLEVQVLEGYRRALGDDHPDTLAAVGNLATTYSNQGRHKQAETLQVQVLEGCRQALGNDHPHTLAAMGNLARTYSDQGLYKQAEMLEVQALEGSKRALGDGHPRTLTAMGNLARTYSCQGLYKQAGTLQVQVLEGRKRALGENHPDTLAAMGNLAGTYSYQGLHKQAETLQVQVLQGRKRALGDNHPDTLTAMANLATTYSYRGLHKRAETLGVQVLEGRKRTLGDDHPRTLTAMGNLARTYSDQRLYKQAEILEVQVLDRRKRTLGNDHPHTLTAMGNLARTYSDQGLHKQAETLQVQMLEGMKRTLGDDHPDTLAAMKNLADTYRHLGLSRRHEYKALEAEIARLDPSDAPEPHTFFGLFQY